MPRLDDFIDDLSSDTTREIVLVIDGLIKDTHPAIHSKLRYNIPFYYLHSWFCYINPLKTGGVEWCFIHGKKLDDPGGLLNSKERKMIAGIEITHRDEAFHENVMSILYSAIEYDTKMKELKDK